MTTKFNVVDLDSNRVMTITMCKRNHVPAVFANTAYRQVVKIDGMLATVLFNPERAKYIVVSIGGYNLYTYDRSILQSTNLADAADMLNSNDEQAMERAFASEPAAPTASTRVKCSHCRQSVIRKARQFTGYTVHARCLSAFSQAV